MPASYRKDSTGMTHGAFLFTPLATPSKGTTELAIWHVDLAPNSVSELHSMDKEEVFVITAGRVLFEVEGVRYPLEAGDAMTILPHQKLIVSNPYPETAAVIACTSRGMRATIGESTFVPPWSL